MKNPVKKTSTSPYGILHFVQDDRESAEASGRPTQNAPGKIPERFHFPFAYLISSRRLTGMFSCFLGRFRVRTPLLYSASIRSTSMPLTSKLRVKDPK